MITLVLIVSERWYCLKGFLSGIKFIRPKGNIDLLIISSSKDEFFNNLVCDFLEDDWKSIQLIKTGFSIYHIVAQNTQLLNEERFTNTVDAFNIGRKEFLRSDNKYVWFIEDDVEIPPNSYEKLLDLLKKENVGIGYTYFTQRWNEKETGLERFPLVWDFIFSRQKITFTPDNKSTREIIPQAIIKYPSQGIWIEEIGAASTGSVIIKREVMEKVEFVLHYKGLSYHDVSFGMQTMDAGFKSYIDWSLKGKHIHITGEVIL